MKELLSAALVAVALAPAAAGADTREITHTVDVEPGRPIEVDFSIGELRIEAVAGDVLTADVVARCETRSERCRKALAGLEIVSRTEGDRTVLEVVGRTRSRGRKLEVEGSIRVPRSAPLIVDMGIGKLEIEGVGEDLSVDMGIGEVIVRLSHQAVASVDLDAGIGNAELRPSDPGARARRPALVGSEVRWDEGPGTAHVVVDLGIGDISVRLE